MVVPLPHQTLTEYLRAFEAGTLEEFCSGTCPKCGNRIEATEYRYRKTLDLWVLRGRCRGACAHSFTFLPIFVAPGKWHSYPVIEEALCFVAQERFADRPTAAFQAWEANRENRLEDGLPPGPSGSTVRRWFAELAQNHPFRPWSERANEALHKIPGQGWPGPCTQCGPDGVPGERPPPALWTNLLLPPFPPVVESTSRCAFPAKVLGILRLLGEALLGLPSADRGSCLGMGLWFLEGRFQQRCLARFELVGNIVPWLIPEMAVNPPFSCGYPPQPPPPS